MGNTSYHQRTLYMPPSLDINRQRELSVNLGEGNCKWESPMYDVPEDIDFFKTLVAGFPSSDKRLIYLQMEALSGFPARDEWDFACDGWTNHPFIKANYPHHEGKWAWGTAADQVILAVPSMRRSMIEYHDILWDLNYATTCLEARAMSGNLFENQAPEEKYHEWKDSRVMDEIHWFGWFIDYWMEGGLMRDVFTHKITTQKHWDMFLKPVFLQRFALDIDLFVQPGTTVPPIYDPHCANNSTHLPDITGGCLPVAVISVDKLRDYDEGPGETARIANALKTDPRTGKYIIEDETWDCIWRELIEKKKGPKTVDNRPGNEGIPDYVFSEEMLDEMLGEIGRLITKYSGPDWSETPTAIRIVEIMEEQNAQVQFERLEVIKGVRKLSSIDFLGPDERSKRALPKKIEKTDDYSKCLSSLEEARIQQKHQMVSEAKQSKEDIDSPSNSDSVRAPVQNVSQRLKQWKNMLTMKAKTSLSW